ncbi:MAG: type III-A CRISPR-associated RAMP protein Csm3, partial [Leptospiraceae bacterium]|nr:type III-A CRISPR-associated RAMP protein Csm3 [Leptospiraceae bacterium]
LEEIIQIKGKMRCITGVSIIGYAASRRIGGVDSPVVRDPMTDFPYIPGSSLRGKMRSLYELKYGKCTKKGEPHKMQEKCKDNCIICRFFGSIPDRGSFSGKNKKEVDDKIRETKEVLGPTRLLVRDAFLVDKSKENLIKYMEKTGLQYTELKMENVINRYRSEAMPRNNERIPAGTIFNLEFLIKIFEGDDKLELLNTFKECLNLVEMDSIGGSGSRGYGKVKFENIKVIEGNKEMELDEFIEHFR